MKLNLNFIYTLIICLSIFSFCSSQLFDVVNKGIESYGGKNSNHNKEMKSLFERSSDDINFNQIREKIKSENENTNNKITKTNTKAKTQTNTHRTKSLISTLNEGTSHAVAKKPNGLSHSFSANASNAHLIPSLRAEPLFPSIKLTHKAVAQPRVNIDNENQDHSITGTLNHIFNDKGMSQKIIFTQKQIKELKDKATMLMELNSKLTKKVKKNKSFNKSLNKKHKRISSDIISLIQKNEGAVVTKKNEITNKKTQAETKLSDKEKELKALYDKANASYTQLHQRLEQVKSKFNAIKGSEIKSLDEMKEKMELKNFEVLKKLDVDGSGYFKKNIVANRVVLGSLRLDSAALTFYNENTKFIIGTEILPLGDLMKNYLLIEKLNAKCGAEMNKCKVVTKQDLVETEKRQEKVLESLNLLNQEAEKILKN